jgi:alkylated DNA repair dioxygenase AlkB
VLANRYRDGQDSMGFHADDEPELGADPIASGAGELCSPKPIAGARDPLRVPDPIVATASLGVSRRFVIKPRRPADGAPLALLLGHGSLLVMAGTCQRHHVHGIPRQPAVGGERVSLTFRCLLAAPLPA